MTKTPRKRTKSKDKKVEQIEVKVAITTLKPIHAKCVVDFYNHMTTPEGEKVISSYWNAARITNTLENGNLFGTIGSMS